MPEPTSRRVVDVDVDAVERPADGSRADGSRAASRSSAVRRTARSLLVAAVVAVPAVGVLAVSGSHGLPAIASSRAAALPMAYDGDEIVALQHQLQVARRTKLADWFRALATSEDGQRASRGEPRTPLAGQPLPGRWWRPTDGRLTQTFHPGHKGIDIGVPLGTPVLSAADGVVTFAGEQTGYGTHVEVTHAGGVVTTYSHLSHIDVVVGQKVQAGQLIALSGNTGHSTGPHLHFEVHPTADTLTDPIAWLEARGAW